MRKYSNTRKQSRSERPGTPAVVDLGGTLVDKLVAAIDADVDRILALVATTSRTLTTEESRTFANYLKTVSDVRKGQKKDAPDDDLDMEALMAQILEVPALREMVQQKASAWDQQTTGVEEPEDE